MLPPQTGTRSGSRVVPLPEKGGNDNQKPGRLRQAVNKHVAPAPAEHQRECSPLERSESSRSSTSARTSSVALSSLVGGVMLMKQHASNLDRMKHDWETMSTRERRQLVYKNVRVCLKDLWLLMSPAVLVVVVSTLGLCFLLVKDPGGSLLSAFLLHGRVSPLEIDCEAFRSMTTCLSTNSTGGENLQEEGRTELGDTLDLASINSGMLLLIGGTGVYAMTFMSLFFLYRCERRYLLMAYVITTFLTGGGLVMWGLSISEAHATEMVSYFVYVMLVFLPLGLFTLNSLCSRPNKVFKSWRDVVIYWALNTMLLLVILVFTRVVLLLETDPELLVLLAEGFALFTSLVAFQLLRRLKSVPPEASAMQLLTVEYVCINLQRTLLTRLESLETVARVAAVHTGIHFTRAIGVLMLKRWRYDRLASRNQLYEQHSLAVLHNTDTVTDMAAELLSVLSLVPARIMADPLVFNVDHGDACEYETSIGQDLAVIGIQLGGEIIVSVFIIFASQWMLGPHTYAYVAQTSSGLALRICLGALVAMSIGAFTKNTLRHACIFCEWQAQGGTCS